MKRHNIDVVENATKVSSINPETPLEKAVADCMRDYLEYRKKEEKGLILELPCAIGSEVWKIINQRDNFTDVPYKIATRTNFRLDMLNEIGKTVFLTEEKANEALNSQKG